MTSLSEPIYLSGPTTEQGRMREPRIGAPSGSSLVSWNQFIDEDEFVQAMRWPQSVTSFNKMRTDSQLSGLHRALTMPIRRFKWKIDPNGAAEPIVKGISEDFGLDIQGAEQEFTPSMRNRFKHGEHLYHCLLSPIYGHMFFEQFGLPDATGLWRLKKLAPRMPETIAEINVADDGGLIDIRQKFRKDNGGMAWDRITIEVDRLAAYPWDKEGAKWIGRSMYRDLYKNWLVKDRLIRVDAINHERAGGVPWIESPPGASPAERAELARMAQSFKVGEEAGGSVPHKGVLNIAKLGSGTDVINSIKYHDEAMARTYLMMFMQLGSTSTGNRALGEVFVQYAFMAQKAWADWYCEITNEHVIEDWVEWNYGPQTLNPKITYEIPQDDEILAVADLVQMIDAGLITIDEELEIFMRDKYNMPKMGENPREVERTADPVVAAKLLAKLETDKRQILDAISQRDHDQD